MADGWSNFGTALGDLFSGGDDAYEEGRLHAIKTESALLEARNRQLTNKALEAEQAAQQELQNQAAALGIDPAALAITRAGWGPDYNSAMSGRATGQEMGFRDRVADPATPNDARQFALAAISGKPFNPLEAVGPASYTDITAPQPELRTTPYGESMIAERDATTRLRNVQAGDPDYQTAGSGGVGVGGMKEPPKYMANPNFDPSRPPDTVTNPMVVPVVGGPADPNVGPAMGTRERAVVARIDNAAANTAGDLRAMVAMPSGASQGVFGIGAGASPGVGIMEATVNSMKLRLAPEEIRQYNSILGGFSNQLRTLEQMGLAGSQGLAAQYDALAFRPEDTVEDKMFKLASVRQSTENALGTILAMNPNMPDDAKARMRTTIANVRQAVPYTREDVIALQAEQRRNPRATLASLIAQRRNAAPVRSTPAAGPAPTSAPMTGTPDPEGWVTMPNGVRVRRKPGT